MWPGVVPALDWDDEDLCPALDCEGKITFDSGLFECDSCGAQWTSSYEEGHRPELSDG